jgi:hypothetical protein
MIVRVGVGGQLSAEYWLTAVPRSVESADSHRIRLKQLLDGVSKGSQISEGSKRIPRNVAADKNEPETPERADLMCVPTE